MESKDLRAEAAALQAVRSSLERLNDTLLCSLYVPRLASPYCQLAQPPFRQDLETTAENMERFADLNRAWAVVFEGEPPLEPPPELSTPSRPLSDP
jgi:hypothetical protein